MEELEEGKSFGTFSDLDNFLKEYEKSKFVQLYKRSSHTIEYHQKKLKQQRNVGSGRSANLPGSYIPVSKSYFIQRV